MSSHGREAVPADAAIAAPAVATSTAPAPRVTDLSWLARMGVDARAAAVGQLQRGAGNAVLSRAILARDPEPAAGPPPSQAEADDVAALMPIGGDIDALVGAVEASCAEWRGWREKLAGPVPGRGAFTAMTTFKTAVADEGFDVYDQRIQRVLRERITGDNRQLLTEMTSFALGTSSGRGGDAQGLAKVCGIQAKVLRHKYTLKIDYSIAVKGEFGVGVGYTYRSAGIFYSNDFGMTYNKPLNMRSGGVSAGGVGASFGGSDGSAEGTDESLSFWEPDDFETEFAVTKLAGGATGGAVKGEVKFHEAVHVFSGKHPSLAFDLMGGSHVAAETSGEIGAEVGVGPEVEAGKMIGGPDVGDTTIKTPTLEDAKKEAEKNKLVPKEQQAQKWMVIGATAVQFATGDSQVVGKQMKLVTDFAKYIVGWANGNPGAEVRFDIVGQASPRWRHPKKGRIPGDLNLKLSQERADHVLGALQGAWDGTVMAQYDATGVMGPELDLDDDHAQASGHGSLDAQAEGAGLDNDDAAYRVASVTAWGKKAPPEPIPAPAP